VLEQLAAPQLRLLHEEELQALRRSLLQALQAQQGGGGGGRPGGEGLLAQVPAEVQRVVGGHWLGAKVA
jgi:hypothetical protein